MQPMCEDCKHFHKHYVKMGKTYSLAGIGHCVKPRLKPRRNAAPACQHYEPLEQKE